MSPLGYRINRAPAPIAIEVVSALRNVVFSGLSDDLARSNSIVGLTRFNRTGWFIGTAFTVKCRPGDNLMLYTALTMLQRGHVLVVDGGGNAQHGLVGELTKLHAQKRGCVGFVIDGAICDVASFDDFPCYARSVASCGSYKDGPGELNVPVMVGGQVVNPGDIFIGDEDGVARFADAETDKLLALVDMRPSREAVLLAEKRPPEGRVLRSASRNSEDRCQAA